jgi:hypothetical protein
MPWSTWVSTDEAHRRASARRGYNKRRQAAAQARRDRVRAYAQRWSTTAAAKVKMARVLGVSVCTVNRDLRALQAAAPLPVICPTCGLPSRLDVDPSTLTDDPAVQARLERAMARLIGAAQDPQAPCLARPRRNDRPGVKGQTLGAPARAV